MRKWVFVLLGPAGSQAALWASTAGFSSSSFATLTVLMGLSKEVAANKAEAVERRKQNTLRRTLLLVIDQKSVEAWNGCEPLQIKTLKLRSKLL